VATIFVNGVFDLLHEGHVHFLRAAKGLGGVVSETNMRVYASTNKVCPPKSKWNHLIVALNSDEYARQLKASKWGDNYPHENLAQRMENLRSYADQALRFDSEAELHSLILTARPCILCKGPDYAGRRVTGDDIAPVIILDTPEPESVKALKIQVYGQMPKTI
jgi:D-beta-D-heptose 7-phosphate kinase / D-beta-D-heptose 1-phosphate adenosyltransferase